MFKPVCLLSSLGVSSQLVSNTQLDETMEKVLMADLYNLTYEASYAESKAKILESCQNCFT